LKKDWLNKYLSDSDLEQIKQEIAKIEQTTCGEIRLSLRAKRTLWEKLYKCHELAVKDFEKLGMTNTKDKTGILIFIIFEERYYDILADEGIYSKIPDSTWKSMEDKIVDEFRDDGYLNGILHIIDRMSDVLSKEFPRKADDVNELSDEVIIH
jgi:uncharacterized membrane protein